MNCNECPICRHLQEPKVEQQPCVAGHASDEVRWHVISQACLESSGASRKPAWGEDYASQPLTGAEVAAAELRWLREGAVRAAVGAQRERRWQPALSGISVAAKLALQETRLADEARKKSDEKQEERARVIDMPEWLHLKMGILSALEPYPDAFRALVESLNRHGD